MRSRGRSCRCLAPEGKSLTQNRSVNNPQVDLVQGANLSWFGFPEDTTPSSRDFLPGLGKGGDGGAGGAGGIGESQQEEATTQDTDAESHAQSVKSPHAPHVRSRPARSAARTWTLPDDLVTRLAELLETQFCTAHAPQLLFDGAPGLEDANAAGQETRPAPIRLEHAKNLEQGSGSMAGKGADRPVPASPGSWSAGSSHDDTRSPSGEAAPTTAAQPVILPGDADSIPAARTWLTRRHRGRRKRAEKGRASDPGTADRAASGAAAPTEREAPEEATSPLVALPPPVPSASDAPPGGPARLVPLRRPGWRDAQAARASQKRVTYPKGWVERRQRAGEFGLCRLMAHRAFA